MFLRVIEVGALAIFGLIVLTQVIIPPFIGKPFFWFFRKPEKDLRAKEVELMDLQARKRVEKLNKRIEKERGAIRKPEQK